MRYHAIRVVLFLCIVLMLGPRGSAAVPTPSNGCNMWMGIDEEEQLHARCFGLCTVPNACVQVEGTSGGLTYSLCKCGGIWSSVCNTAYSLVDGVLNISCENQCRESCDIVPPQDLYNGPVVPCFCDN